MINNQDQYSQSENDETSGAEYPNENDLEEAETSKTSAFHNATNITKQWNRRGYKFLKFKAEGSLQCGSYMDQKLCKWWTA